jgi:hypothetical protein
MNEWQPNFKFAEVLETRTLLAELIFEKTSGIWGKCDVGSACMTVVSLVAASGLMNL